MQDALAAAATEIRSADALLIAASNGLSIADGFHIFADSQWFRIHFGDFRELYGVRSPLEAMSYPYRTMEEKWAVYSRMAQLLHYTYTPSDMMRSLFDMANGKDYFVVTTNGEDHFTPTGFDPERLFTMEGRLSQMRCSAGCTQQIVPLSAEDAARMAQSIQNCRIPRELIPVCEYCGALMEPNMAEGPDFFQRLPFQQKQNQFLDFVRRHQGHGLVILELGIGWRNQIIKQPLMQLTAADPTIRYITINRGEVHIPPEIRNQSVGIDGDLRRVLLELAEK